MRFVGNFFAAYAAIFVASAFLLSACTGVSVESEKKERERLQKTEEIFLAAELPVLTENSPQEDYILYALLNNPRVKGAFYDWKASAQAIAAERSLPDPKIEFQMDITNTIMSIMPGFMAEYTLPQKREAMGDLASADALAAYYEFRKTALESAAMFLAAWADYEFYKTSVEYRGRQLESLRKNYEYARAEYETESSGTLAKQVKSDLEVSFARLELANALDGLKYSEAAFKSALGIAKDLPNPPMPSAYPEEITEFDADALWDIALNENPDIYILRAASESAAAGVRVAESSELPDFEIGLEADAKASPVMYRPKAAMTLPLWRDKIESYITSAESAEKAAAFRLDSAKIELAARMAQAEYELSESRRIAEYIGKEALPKIDASIAISNAGYESGVSDLGSSVELETLRADYALQRAEAEKNARKAFAELRYLVLGAVPPNVKFLSETDNLQESSK